MVRTVYHTALFSCLLPSSRKSGDIVSGRRGPVFETEAHKACDKGNPSHASYSYFYNLLTLPDSASTSGSPVSRTCSVRGHQQSHDGAAEPKHGMGLRSIEVFCQTCRTKLFKVRTGLRVLSR